MLAAVLYGCYPGGAEFISDQDITATEYNYDYYDPGSTPIVNKFKEWKTYYLPDTVVFESNDDEAELSPAEQALIIQKFEEEFASRNYVRIDTTSAEAPDFTVAVQVLTINNSGGTWIPPSWPGYYPPGWGWWGPGYGWGYPGYWIPYNYTTGTLSAFIGVPDDAASDPLTGDVEVPVAWRAVFNGLVSSSASNNEARILSGIQKAFDQSPYLESTN
jgi:hypothetical protein